MTELTLLDRFREMVRMRHFDEACLEGVPTREIHGELQTGIGQEGIAAGMLGALRDGDAVVSTHRNHYHALAKGVPERDLLAEIYERETGLCRGRGGHMHPFDLARNFSASGIVGASIPVALGYAYAASIERRDNVAVAVIGDGAANHGTFHECLNIAGAWELPLVVLVENNEYAISVRALDVIATETIAERASAYGAWGERVDGTDVEAVAVAFAQAMRRARAGAGVTVLEALCSRWQGHYEGDIDQYRTKEEKARMRGLDPIDIARRRLLERGLADEAELDGIVTASKERMRALLEDVRRDPLPPADQALRYVFADEEEGAPWPAR
jgi:pyruvate dehydrogenase E1 component alpha subunit